MKLTIRQKDIKAELDRLNRWNMACYPPARDYFYQCRKTPSKREKRLIREFWAIAGREARAV